MVKNLKSFLKKENLVDFNTKTLLAVSGGIDSVVMVHLFAEAQLPFGIAHCNFQLRAQAADEDEQFVRALAHQFSCPFFSIRFETEQLAVERKESIQLVARNLRYEWLETIRQKHDYQHIATAHHHDDSLETVLYNFTKGTGIRGLRGIPVKNNFLIRPLLFTEKASILAYAKTNDVAYRIDESNLSDKYTRNRIRHHLIPELKKINPSLSSSSKQTIQNLRETEQLFQWAIEQIGQKVMTKQEQVWQIDLLQLQQFPASSSVLFELLKPFGFNNDQVRQMLLLDDKETGQQFLSPSHRLYHNRQHLLLQAIVPFSEEIKSISENQKEFTTSTARFLFQELNTVPNPIPKEKDIAYLDLSRLQFPLRLRHWKPGDYFHPLGMNGQRQKIKDFFVNKKLSVLEKKQIWILESADEICWVVGHRLDERFKIKATTERVLEVRWIRANESQSSI